MKLVRFGKIGSEKPGILDAELNIRDISRYISDFTASTLADASFLHKIRGLDLRSLPKVAANVRIGPPIFSPGKFIFIGFNSYGHAQELGLNLAKNCEPIIFLKPNSSISGPFDPICYTKNMQKLDWEAELAIVIGKKGKYISEKDASDYIFGYTCCNDLTERHLQFATADKQFTKGKCFDGSAPIGPYIVTKDEIPDSSNLEIKLWVNENLRQCFNTQDYIHNDKALIAFASQFFTLYPGDIISMGSAPGCAESWSNSFLKPGDIITLQISGIGVQKQKVILE